MIEILPTAPHVAAFQFRGALTGEDYDHCIADIEARLEHHPRIAVFCDMVGLESITLAAMGKDFRYAISKLGEYHRFARGAVVTERDWLARLTRSAAFFFPRTELRTFVPSEREAAMAWVCEPLPQA